MESLGEIPPDPPTKKPLRIIQPAIIILCFAAAAYVILQSVLNSEPRLLARASLELDRIAAMRLDRWRTKEELHARGMEFHGPISYFPFNGHPYRGSKVMVRLPPSRIDKLRDRFNRYTGFWSRPPQPPYIGELHFYDFSKFAGGYNYRTRMHYVAAETTAPQ